MMYSSQPGPADAGPLSATRGPETRREVPIITALEPGRALRKPWKLSPALERALARVADYVVPASAAAGGTKNRFFHCKMNYILAAEGPAFFRADKTRICPCCGCTAEDEEDLLGRKVRGRKQGNTNKGVRAEKNSVGGRAGAEKREARKKSVGGRAGAEKREARKSKRAGAGNKKGGVKKPAGKETSGVGGTNGVGGIAAPPPKKDHRGGERLLPPDSDEE